jgi:hypothetical protein
VAPCAGLLCVIFLVLPENGMSCVYGWRAVAPSLAFERYKRAAMAVNGQIADAAAHFGGKAKVVVQAEQRLPHSSDRSAVGAEQLDGLKQGQAAFDRRCVMRQGLKGFAPAVIGARSDTRGQMDQATPIQLKQ